MVPFKMIIHHINPFLYHYLRCIVLFADQHGRRRYLGGQGRSCRNLSKALSISLQSKTTFVGCFGSGSVRPQKILRGTGLR